MSRIDQVLSAVGAMAILLSAAGCATGPSKSEKAAAPPAPPPKISMLYATPNVVENGESSQLCYSVEDTTKVTLDPPVDRVWPALSRCLEIKPVKTTTYTLTAENAARAWVTATTVVKVVAASLKLPNVQILNVSAPKADIQSGQGFQFCVHARNAKNWKLSSGQWFNPPESTGGCVIDHPTKTTIYVITAIGASGETDSTRVTATVK